MLEAIGVVALFLVAAILVMVAVAVFALPSVARENDLEAMTTGRLPAPRAPGPHPKKVA